MLVQSDIIGLCRPFGGTPMEDDVGGVSDRNSTAYSEVWTISVTEGAERITETLSFPSADEVVKARAAVAKVVNSLEARVTAERHD